MDASAALLWLGAGVLAGAVLGWALGRARVARLESDLENERRAAGEKLGLLEQAERQLREAFQSLSAEALRQNNQSFLDLARASLGEFQKGAQADLEARHKAVGDLVKPVQERLTHFDTHLQGLERARVDAYATLTQQVRSLAETTTNLERALRTPAVRGRWGEIQLRRVVEMAGMLDHCDFYEQETAAGEEGLLRPDLLIRLPGGKNVIVDAKVPLEAYLGAAEAPDDPAREARLRDHARQVRDHMVRLGGKAYWRQFDPAPEFVCMFLPGENLFSAALQQEPALIEFGVEQRVIPASPITLIALLRAVAYGWQQERVARAAGEIARLGQDLFGRLRVLAGHFENLRNHLEKAVGAFNQAVGSLESRVLVAARRFRDLGVPAEEDLPEIPPVETAARGLQAEDLVALPEPEGAAEEEKEPAV